ncbi:uncharacterized protein LOC135961886 [Calliphora vicina]|uniref:uncharacterized protein LOC135961886 n=1 Tax=Calliphora vicina TaxID=7373 RepID=UPI00325C0B0D
MKLNEAVSGSPVVTPLKISSVLGQKLSKVEPTQKNELLENGAAAANDEDFDNFPDDDEEDSTKDEDVAGFVKENIKMDLKLVDMEVVEGGGGGGGSVGVVADGIAGGGVDNDTAETEEESNAGVKKKGVRKKRSINWEEAERSLLVEVIKPKVDFVENKAVDAKSIKSKRMAWLHVTKQFNSLNFRHRSLEQIQVQWRSMKNSAKKEYQQKHPKSTSPLEGLQMLEFMEEMQKEPIMGGTRSQTRNSTIQNSVKKELLDDMDDEEEDTPLAALPNTLLNHSNSEDTQPTSTLALPSPPTSADSHHLEYQQQQQLMEVNNIRMKKKKSLPKIKQKLTNTKSPLLSSKLQEKSSSGVGIGLKIKRQKCETSTSSSSLTDVSTTGIMLTSMSNANASYHTTDSKTANNNTISLTASNLNTPPLSPPICLDEKYKKQLFDLVKRARLAEIDFARKEHEQKLRFEQQEQELKLRYMTEIHEQRMRFCMQEHEARMRVFSTATVAAKTNEI